MCARKKVKKRTILVNCTLRTFKIKAVLLQRQMKIQTIIKKTALFFLTTLMCICMNAQNLEHVFDMDELVANEGFLLSQNNPNPFNGSTDIYLAVMDRSEVTLVVTNVYGQLAAIYTGSFESGIHQFRIYMKTKGNYVIGAH